MVNLTINSSNDDLKSIRVEKYNLTVNDESLKLEFKAASGDIVYWINKDNREPNITLIKEYISDLLKGGEICIREYSERKYIFVKGEDAVERQFTGGRI